MNKTQERITTAYTIGHAEQTVEALLSNTETEISRDEKKGVGGADYVKLRKVRLALSDLLAKVKEVRGLINSIDDSNSNYSLISSKSEVVVTDLEGRIICRLIKSDYEQGEAINNAYELVKKLDKTI
jgi:hypothetical protein